jgi:hypothetical protein
MAHMSDAGGTAIATQGTLTEMRIGFDSGGAWVRWNAEHNKKFPGWRAAVAAAVAANGLIEPVTGTTLAASAVTIRPGALAESLTGRQLNSRKRALLLEMASRLQQRPAGEDVRVLVVDGPKGRFCDALRSACFIYGADADPGQEDSLFDFVVVADTDDTAAAWVDKLRHWQRQLKPNGWLVATPRFNSEINRPHDAPPPTDKAPGWEMLDHLRQSGFHSARMMLNMSTRHGVVGDGVPGIFILAAQKAAGGAAQAAPSPARAVPAAPGRLVCLLGAPRSGTTMLAASLAVSPGVAAVYEPFNRDDDDRWKSGGRMTLPRFLADYRVPPGSRALLVKETCKSWQMIDRIDQLLDSVEAPVGRHCILILRNPFHCLLSELQGRREWWGERDLVLNHAEFDIWAEKTLTGLVRMLSVIIRTRGTCISYAQLSRNPQLVRAVTEAAGLEYVAEQLSFHEHINPKMIHGDPSLIHNPRPIGAGSETKREEELLRVRELVAGAQFYPAVERIADMIRHTDVHPRAIWDLPSVLKLQRFVQDLRYS